MKFGESREGEGHPTIFFPISVRHFLKGSDIIVGPQTRNQIDLILRFEIQITTFAGFI